MYKICVVTATRAEYGVLKNTIKRIIEDEELNLYLVATGMHLSRQYGYTIQEIIDDGIGMDYADLSRKYVWIGRNKRKDVELLEDDKKNVMGRKGIGKLAAGIRAFLMGWKYQRKLRCVRNI